MGTKVEVRNKQQSPPSTPLFMLFWCIGLLVGLFARDFLETAGEHVRVREQPTIASSLPQAPAAASTISVEVHAVLDLPSPTLAPPPRATSTPSASAVAGLDFCGAQPAQDGAVCRMPAATATVTPTLPSCFSPQSEAGKVCQYRATPTPMARTVMLPTTTPSGAAPTNAAIPLLCYDVCATPEP